MEHKSLTIFTPTFNRVHTLPLLYESLRIQTCKDFRWVIVDDGSTDRTSSVVEKWIEEKLVDIEYHFQENSGKMAAHNFAVDKSDTEWFMCLDSDDRLADEDTVADCLDFFRQADSEDICGIISYKSFGSGHNVFPKGMEKVHLEELRRAGYMGELVMTMKTSILKKHK
ncbi:MAG: glycosyltransferase family 2 protein, partial [Bacteroidales bacterium]|nr:glycosyltransferase family 2 protein [Bacteroidales bacterium]